MHFFFCFKILIYFRVCQEFCYQMNYFFFTVLFTHCSWVLVPFYGAKIQIFYASPNLSWNYHRFQNFTYCKVKFQSNFVVISQNFVNLFFVFFMRQNFMSISCYWKMKVVMAKSTFFCKLSRQPRSKLYKTYKLDNQYEYFDSWSTITFVFL